MKSIVKFFIYMGLISLVLYTSGCINKTDITKENAPDAITLERSSPAPVLAAQETIPTLADFVDQTTVALYFSDGKGRLVAEQRKIPKVEGIAQETMRQLCTGPKSDDLKQTVPAGTELLDINIRDGLCTLDFSKAVISAHQGGSENEYLTVYSIVNTMTQFATVEKVQIRVEGAVVETIAGHVDISAPLVRDEDIISAATEWSS